MLNKSSFSDPNLKAHFALSSAPCFGSLTSKATPRGTSTHMLHTDVSIMLVDGSSFRLVLDSINVRSMVIASLNNIDNVKLMRQNALYLSPIPTFGMDNSVRHIGNSSSVSTIVAELVMLKLQTMLDLLFSRMTFHFDNRNVRIDNGNNMLPHISVVKPPQNMLAMLLNEFVRGTNMLVITADGREIAKTMKASSKGPISALEAEWSGPGKAPPQSK